MIRLRPASTARRRGFGETGSPSTRGVAIAALAAALLTVAWRFLIFNGFTNDQYVHLALAQQLLLGDVPVRDFADPGLPLMYLVSAGAWKVWGGWVGVEWAVCTAAFAGGAALTTIAASRLSGSILVALAVTMLTVLLSPRDYSYPKVLLYAAAGVAILAVASRPSTRRIAALGALVAIAFLFRHDHGVYIGAAALASVVLAGWGEGVRLITRRLLILAAATAIVLSPWILFIVSAGPAAYLTHAMDVARAEAGVTLLDQLPSFGGALDTRANAAAWLFWLFWLLPVWCVALVLLRPERWPGERTAIAALAVLAVGVNAGFLRDVLIVRVPDAAVPAALLGAWALGRVFTRHPRTTRASHAAALVAAVALLAITGAAVHAVADLQERRARAGLTLEGIPALRESAERSLRMLRSSHRDVGPSRFSRALIPFFEYTDRCTTTSDRLLITGLFPDILVLAERGFGGGTMALALGHTSEERQEDTVAHLRERPPLFVLADPSLGERFEQIARHIADAYEPLTEWPIPGAGSITILVDRNRPASGTDPMTGFPCYR